VIRCRGLKFRDEDDAYEYFKQRELDEANDQSLLQIFLPSQSGKLESAAPGVPSIPAEEGP
jgi:hypothetical protein